MKNIKTRWQKTCLCLTLDETTKILEKMRNVTSVTAHPDLDGLWFSSEEWDEWDDPDDNEVCTLLSAYFDVNVTSFHLDDCAFEPGVWIVYDQTRR